MTIYKVVGCPHCGALRLFTGNKVFKCMSCGKSTEKFKVRYESAYPEEARKALYEIRQEAR